MKIRKLLISMLGLGIFVHPAFATMTFLTGTGGNTQYNTAVLTAGLTPEGPFTFTGSNLVGSTEYADPTSLIDFFAFSNRNSSSNPGPNATLSVSGTQLVASNSAGTFEALLPANVFAFAIHFATTSAAIDCLGVNATDSGCSNQFVVSGSSDDQFFGVVSTTPISSVWIGVTFGGAPIALNFSAATGGASATPEAGSIFLLGLGLVAIGVLKFRRRAVGRYERCSLATPQP